MPTTLTPEERRLRATAGAYAQHAQHDPRATTKAARQALWAKYYALADPEATLDQEERQRRARALMRKDLALASMKAARQRRERAEAELADRLIAGGMP
jgi:hypothetical protein